MSERAERVRSLVQGLGITEEQAQQVLDLLEGLGPSDAGDTFDLDAPPEWESQVVLQDGTMDAVQASGLTTQPEAVDDSSKELTAEGQSPDPDPDPESGELGRYEDLGVLGIGGMGEVRRVRDPTLKRTLAMKIIHLRLLKHRGAVSRFVEEAQVGAQLQHPNIPPVHERGRLSDGRHYFTMKEIHGTALTAAIRAVHKASDAKSWHPAKDGTTFRHLVQTFHQVCVTMAYAHASGVIHRDLKPDNIMVGGFGEVLVVDWGLAKVMGSRSSEALEDESAVETVRTGQDQMATRVGSVSGTPCYMSPEQARGET